MSKMDSYTTWMSILVRATSGLRGGLELGLLWASALATRNALALSLLLDLDTLAGLLLHAMRQLWLYAWGSFYHHPLLLDEKPSSASIMRLTNQKLQQACSLLIGMYTMFVNTTLQKILLTRGSIGVDNIWILAATLDPFSWLQSCTTKKESILLLM